MQMVLNLDGPNSTLCFGDQKRHLPPFVSTLSLIEKEDLRWYLEDYLSQKHRLSEDRADRVVDKYVAWGHDLFQQFIAPANDLWNQALDCVPELTLIVESESADKLSLPFELMRDPNGEGWFVDRLLGISRRHGPQDRSSVVTTEGAVRILMIAPRPKRFDVPIPDSFSGLGLIAADFDIDFRVVRPPTFSHMKHLLQEARELSKPWQVIVFDGHGEFVERGGQSGTEIIFQQHPHGGESPRSVAEFGQMIDESGVRLVILSACRSATVQPSGRHSNFTKASATTSFALALNRRCGVPVVAMSYAILAETASRFVANAVYNWLIGKRLDLAVRDARRSIAESSEGTVERRTRNIQDWLVPTIYGDPFLQLSQAVARRPNPFLSDVQPLAGRNDDLKRIEQAFSCAPVVHLYGKVGVGKTVLADTFSRWWVTTGGKTGRVTSRHLTLSAAGQLAVLRGITNEIYYCLNEVILIVELPQSITSWMPVEQQEFLQLLRSFEQCNNDSVLLLISRSPAYWLAQANSSMERVGLHGLGFEGFLQLPSVMATFIPERTNSIDDELAHEYQHMLSGEPWLLEQLREAIPRVHTGSKHVSTRAKESAWLLEEVSHHGSTICSVISEIAEQLDSKEIELLYMLVFTRGLVGITFLTALSEFEGTPDPWCNVQESEWTILCDKLVDLGLASALQLNTYCVSPALLIWLESGRENTFESEAYVDLERTVANVIAVVVLELDRPSKNLTQALQASLDRAMHTSDVMRYPYLKHVADPQENNKLSASTVLGTASIFFFGAIDRTLTYALEREDFQIVSKLLRGILSDLIEQGKQTVAERWLKSIHAVAQQSKHSDTKAVQIVIKLVEIYFAHIEAVANGSSASFARLSRAHLGFLIADSTEDTVQIAHLRLASVEFGFSYTNIPDAVDELTKAAKVFEEAGMHSDLAQCWIVLSTILIAVYDYEGAAESLDQAGRLYELSTDASNKFSLYAARCELALQQGEFMALGENLSLLERSALSLESRTLNDATAIYRAVYEVYSGRLKSAAQGLEKALMRNEKLGYLLNGRLLFTRAEVSLEGHEYDEAQLYFDAAAGCFRTNEDYELLGRTLLHISKLKLRSGSLNESYLLALEAKNMLKDDNPILRDEAHQHLESAATRLEVDT